MEFFFRVVTAKNIHSKYRRRGLFVMLLVATAIHASNINVVVSEKSTSSSASSSWDDKLTLKLDRQLRSINTGRFRSRNIDSIDNVDPLKLKRMTSECFTEWRYLAVAVMTSHTLQEPDEAKQFYICPNSIMNVESPIEIPSDGYQFHCGTGTSSTSSSSKKNKNCVIRGGWAHFKIVSNVKNIYFHNLSFTESTVASIIAAGEKDSSVDFDNCIWSSNEGKVAILIYNEAKGIPITENVQIQDLPESREPSMNVYFSKCIFAKNRQLEFGTILNFGGKLSLTQTLFAGNVMNEGLISSKYHGILALSDSCYIINRGLLPGIIRVDDGGLLTANKDTYGQDNTSRFGSCNQIFLEVGPSCVGNNGVKCIGICADFTKESSCSIDLEDPTIKSILDSIDLTEFNGGSGTNNNDDDGGGGGGGNNNYDDDATIVYIAGGAVVGLLALCSTITICLLMRVNKNKQGEYTQVLTSATANDDKNNNDNNNSDERKEKNEDKNTNENINGNDEKDDEKDAKEDEKGSEKKQEDNEAMVKVVKDKPTIGNASEKEKLIKSDSEGTKITTYNDDSSNDAKSQQVAENNEEKLTADEVNAIENAANGCDMPKMPKFTFNMKNVSSVLSLTSIASDVACIARRVSMMSKSSGKSGNSGKKGIRLFGRRSSSLESDEQAADMDTRIGSFIGGSGASPDVNHENTEEDNLKDNITKPKIEDKVDDNKTQSGPQIDSMNKSMKSSITSKTNKESEAFALNKSLPRNSQSSSINKSMTSNLNIKLEGSEKLNNSVKRDSVNNAISQNSSAMNKQRPMMKFKDIPLNMLPSQRKGSLGLGSTISERSEPDSEPSAQMQTRRGQTKMDNGTTVSDPKSDLGSDSHGSTNETTFSSQTDPLRVNNDVVVSTKTGVRRRSMDFLQNVGGGIAEEGEPTSNRQLLLSKESMSRRKSTGFEGSEEDFDIEKDNSEREIQRGSTSINNQDERKSINLENEKSIDTGNLGVKEARIKRNQMLFEASMNKRRPGRHRQLQKNRPNRRDNFSRSTKTSAEMQKMFTSELEKDVPDLNASEPDLNWSFLKKEDSETLRQSLPARPAKPQRHATIN